MVERAYLVSVKYKNEFNGISSGHCTTYLKKENYTESELVKLFIESARINFDLEKNQEVVITNIINLTKIRKDLEE